MDTSILVDSLQEMLRTHLPNIVGALAILVVGWLVALIARAGVRGLLGRLGLDARIRDATGHALQVERWIALGVFWVIVLFTLVGMFRALDLTLVSTPFQTVTAEIVGYLPRLVAGTLLALIAWLAATVLRTLVVRGLAKTDWDERFSAQAGMEPIGKSMGSVVFWLVILLFVPAILAAYNLTGVLAPVQIMLQKALAILPNVFAAFVIGFVGWLVARCLRGLVTNLLAVVGTDRLGERAGPDASVRLSRIAGTLVFIFTFVPSLIAALDALQIEAVSRPATSMLGQFLDAVPRVFAAALILVVTWYVARFAADLVTRLLESIGLDLVPGKLGVQRAFAARGPSALAGKLVLFFAMLFATVEAANQLQFTQVRDIVSTFIRFGGDVLLGSAILVIGFWLANVAHAAIARSGASHAAGVARLRKQ